MKQTTELSDLAEGIIEAYWILCEPAEVVSRAIDEFAEWNRLGRPFTYFDEPVTAEQLLMALDEVVRYFEGRQMWPVGEPDKWVGEQPIRRTVGGYLRRVCRMRGK